MRIPKNPTNVADLKQPLAQERGARSDALRAQRAEGPSDAGSPRPEPALPARPVDARLGASPVQAPPAGAPATGAHNALSIQKASDRPGVTRWREGLTAEQSAGLLAQSLALDLGAAGPEELRAALRPFESKALPLDELSPERLQVGVELVRLFADQGAAVVQALLPLITHPAATIGAQGVDNARHINLVFRNAARGEEPGPGALRELAASVGTDLLGKGATTGLPITRMTGLTAAETLQVMALPPELAGERPATIIALLERSARKAGAMGDLARQYGRFRSGELTPDDTILATRQREIERALAGVSEQARSILAPLLGKLKHGELNLGQLFGELAKANNAEASGVFNVRVMSTQAFLKFLPPLAGTFAHNYTHPQVTFDLAKRLGLSDADALTAAAEQVMHGFGNAFVTSGYPVLPDFASIRIEAPGANGKRRLLAFTPEQVGHLEAVGRAAMRFAQDLAIPPDVVAAHPEWRFPPGAPLPTGFQALAVYAINVNGGVLPESFLRYLADRPETVELVGARRAAGLLSRQADVDNDSNFGGASIGKWLGIMKNTVPNANEASLAALISGIAGKHQGLTWPANTYRAEQSLTSPDGPAAFDHLFLPSAGALGLELTPGGYKSILERTPEGRYQVGEGADPDAVARAASALRAVLRSPAPGEGAGQAGARPAADVALIEDFYNRKAGATYPVAGREVSCFELLVRVGSAEIDLDRPMS